MINNETLSNLIQQYNLRCTVNFENGVRVLISFDECQLMFYSLNDVVTMHRIDPGEDWKVIGDIDFLNTIVENKKL